MDMYSNKAASIPQKATITAIEIALIAISVWILFGSAQFVVADWFGMDISDPMASPIPNRRWLILGFSLVLVARMAFTMFRFMRRAIPWAETLSIPFAFALYYIGFSILVLPSSASLDGIDGIAIALYIIGSWLNTGGELGRDRFKRNPANQGKLYTAGFFAWSMHINFFGDILWVVAFALVARNPWGALIPLLLTLFFAFYNVPALDRYLAGRYGQEFEAYRKRTKRLIPFIW